LEVVVMVAVAAVSSVILILVTTMTIAIASIVLSSAPLKCLSTCWEDSMTPMEHPSRKWTTSCVTLRTLWKGRTNSAAIAVIATAYAVVVDATKGHSSSLLMRITL
jgi:hypothetical protein